MAQSDCTRRIGSLPAMKESYSFEKRSSNDARIRSPGAFSASTLLVALRTAVSWSSGQPAGHEVEDLVLARSQVLEMAGLPVGADHLGRREMLDDQRGLSGYVIEELFLGTGQIADISDLDR